MIRIILIFILIAMLLRILIIAGRHSEDEKPFSWKGFRDFRKIKGVPKELGEYIDFEETKKKKK
jgi:hypothetical protein